MDSPEAWRVWIGVIGSNFDPPACVWSSGVGRQISSDGGLLVDARASMDAHPGLSGPCVRGLCDNPHRQEHPSASGSTAVRQSSVSGGWPDYEDVNDAETSSPATIPVMRQVVGGRAAPEMRSGARAITEWAVRDRGLRVLAFG